MKILQGKYIKSVESAKGTLKGIELKTPAGKQTIKLPKALRAIAQAELTLGDNVRIWASTDKTSSQKTGKKKASKKKKRQSSAQASQLTALQIIPIAPKAQVALPETASSKATNAKAKKQRTKPLTVQLCQKKNCCRKGGDKLWTAFEAAAQAAKTSAEKRAFKLEAVGCLGGCKNGPNIRLLPKNVKHRNVKPSDIEALVGRL